VDLVERGRLKTLLDKDQLRQQMEEKAAFRGFREGDISFVPTFKVYKAPE